MEATTTTKTATNALAGMTTEAEFARFYTLAVGEAVKTLARLIATGLTMDEAAGRLYSEMMEFDTTGVTALFVRENLDAVLAPFASAA